MENILINKEPAQAAVHPAFTDSVKAEEYARKLGALRLVTECAKCEKRIVAMFDRNGRVVSVDHFAGQNYDRFFDPSTDTPHFETCWNLGIRVPEEIIKAGKEELYREWFNRPDPELEKWEEVK